METLVLALDLVGTFVFALSGAVAGVRHRLDLFGVLVLAFAAGNAPVNWIAGAITFVGRQDNLAVREAALFAFGANLLMILAAIISIMLTVPKGRLREETHN